MKAILVAILIICVLPLSWAHGAFTCEAERDAISQALDALDANRSRSARRILEQALRQAERVQPPYCTIKDPGRTERLELLADGAVVFSE